MNQTLPSITEASIHSLARKLQEFVEALPPDEQAVISWLLQRAAGADEVHGFSAMPIAPERVQEAVLDALDFSIPR